MIVFRDYPYWPALTLGHVIDILRDICNARKDDISQIANIGNIFISGRKVGRIPTSSSDVIDGDKVGDFNVTDSFAYYLIDNGGTGEWRRVAVGSF